jgi:hypothetical protein
VFAAFVFVIALIAATPFIALADGQAVQGIAAALAALAMATISWSIPPGEARRLSKLVGPIAIGMAIPAIWMAVQAAPMPVRGLSHPIWASAAAALGKPLTGRISADPGATLVAITRYLTLVGIVIAAAAVTIDRRRAEAVLLWLTGSAALAGIMLILRPLVDFSFAADANNSEVARALMALCVLGVPLSAAAAGHTLERYERRRTRAEKSLVRFALAAAGAAAGLVICLIALFLSATIQLFLIAVCGLAIVAGLAIVRRLGVSPWFSAAAAATAVISVVAVASIHSSGRANPTLRYADAPARSIEIAETIMADTAWTGSGGGAYAAILPIYREVNDAPEVLSAPTAAAEISVELGKPMLWALVGMFVLAVAYLLRGALTRGRDSFYANAGASATIVLMLEAFSDASGLATSVGVLASAVLGLGIAQSRSRSIE